MNGPGTQGHRAASPAAARRRRGRVRRPGARDTCAPRAGASVAGTGRWAILPAVEQSRGSNIPLVQAAGIDPAYVPGIVLPEPDEPQVTSADPSADLVKAEPAADDAPSTAEDVPAGDAAVEESAEEPPLRDPEPDGGPVFEVADRRGSIRADRSGITFRLDDTEAEFGWDEIGAVEVDAPWWGRRFGVTVYLSPRRWYETWVEAPARSRLKTWSEELDAVLDVYFEKPEDPEAREKSEDLEGSVETAEPAGA